MLHDAGVVGNPTDSQKEGQTPDTVGCEVQLPTGELILTSNNEHTLIFYRDHMFRILPTQFSPRSLSTERAAGSLFLWIVPSFLDELSFCSCKTGAFLSPTSALEVGGSDKKCEFCILSALSFQQRHAQSLEIQIWLLTGASPPVLRDPPCAGGLPPCPL